MPGFGGHFGLLLFKADQRPPSDSKNWSTVGSDQSNSPTAGGHNQDASLEYVDQSGNLWILQVSTELINGRDEVVGVEIMSASKNVAINQGFLRTLPFSRILQDAFADADEGLNIQPIAPAFSTLPHHGRTHTDAELRALAEVYAGAYKKRRSVQQAVSEAFGISKSTAVKRIMVARKRGFIDPQMNRKIV